MDCATFPKQSLVNLNVSSTAERQLKKLMTVEMIASDFNIGRGKELPVSLDILPCACLNPSDSPGPWN
jgi:hypothetical protein